MMEKQKKQTASKLEEQFNISDEHLESAYRDFVTEKPKQKADKSLVNFATVSGGIMLVLAMFAILQNLGLNIGPDISLMMHVMPLVGGLLVLILGLGWFKRRKKKRKTKKDEIPEFKYAKSKKKAADDAIGFDSYAFREKRKLMRSRTNKRIFGVCGGIADYFGLDPTIVRVLFALSVVFWGSTVIVYFILAIAMKKEPGLSDKPV
jgi:phage shock protein C